MERLERRAIGRVAFPSRAVLVICDTEEVIHVRVRDIGPIGVGIIVELGTADLLGKDVILAAETLIMYADVVRVTQQEDGNLIVGLAARKFPESVLRFLMDSIEKNASEMEGVE